MSNTSFFSLYLYNDIIIFIDPDGRKVIKSRNKKINNIIAAGIYYILYTIHSYMLHLNTHSGRKYDIIYLRTFIIIIKLTLSEKINLIQSDTIKQHIIFRHHNII